MNITSAKYIKHPKEDRNISIWATIDGQKMGVPLDEDNRHYAEIKRQVDAGELTIEEAD
tara:strand:- start:39 stop:215 length:177 start_codon:yes stop_codon:yes gene_type:complete